MGEQHNLTEENVERLTEQLEKMKKTNPNLTYNFWEENENVGFPDNGKTEKDMIRELSDKIDILTDKIDRIFGKSILINGVFKDIQL